MFDTQSMDVRLSRRLGRGEFAALVFVFSFASYFLFTRTGCYVDYDNYLNGARGDLVYYFYGPWLLPALYLFSLLPFELGYLIWIVLSILGVWFATRVFNANSILPLLSYHLSAVLFYGQITGLLAGCLAILWWAMQKKKWHLAGLALFLVVAKPLSAGVLGGLLWLLAEIPWRQKVQVLILPTAGFILSFLVSPSWLVDIYSRLGTVDTTANISLWQWIGPYSLLLFAPALLVPLSRERRFITLASTALLTIPYCQQAELLLLLIFPVGSLPVLLSYAPAALKQFFAYDWPKVGAIVALAIYLEMIGRGILRVLPRIDRVRSYSAGHSEAVSQEKSS